MAQRLHTKLIICSYYRCTFLYNTLWGYLC